MPQLRTIGRSELETPPLVLGGNVFGWTADTETSFAILDAFVAGGGRMIDTSDYYSAYVPGLVGGESETVIGAWLARRGRRDDVQIATKVGLLAIDGVKGIGRDHVNKAIDASLKRLGTDYVDLYYVHRDRPEEPLDEVAETFDALVRSGRVRAIAASNFTPERLAAALDVQAGITSYVAVQNQYNLLERAEYEGGMQAVCVERGVAMLPYFGLANGYLTGKYRTAEDIAANRARGGSVAGYHEGKGPAVLAAMDAVAEETGASLAQIALAWTAAQPGVAAPIASATSVAQVETLVGAMALTLSAAQLARLDAASA